MGGVVVAVGGVTVGWDAVAVGCACCTEVVGGSGVSVGSSARVHAAAAIAIAAAVMSATSHSDGAARNGRKFMVVVFRVANLRRHGLQGHAPCVGGG